MFYIDDLNLLLLQLLLNQPKDIISLSLINRRMVYLSQQIQFSLYPFAEPKGLTLKNKVDVYNKIYRCQSDANLIIQINDQELELSQDGLLDGQLCGTVYIDMEHLPYENIMTLFSKYAIKEFFFELTPQINCHMNQLHFILLQIRHVIQNAWCILIEMKPPYQSFCLYFIILVHKLRFM